MKLSEYIKMLQEFSHTCNDLTVVMTQNGYYADGDIADLYSVPEVKEVTIKEAHYKWISEPGKQARTSVLISPAHKERVIVLGNSQQSY